MHLYRKFIDKFKNIKIRNKLAMSFGILLFLFIITGVYTVLSLSKIQSNEEKIKDFYYPAADAAMEVKFAVVQVQQWLTDASATGSEDGFEEAAEFAALYREKSKLLKELYKDDPAKLQDIEEMDAAFENYYAVGQKMAKAYITEGREAGNILMEEFDETSEVIQGYTVKLEEDAMNALKGVIEENDKAIYKAKMAILLLITITIVLSAIIAYILIKIIATPLETLKRDADIIAGGDYNHKLTDIVTRDEIGEMYQSFKRMTKSVLDNMLKAKAAFDTAGAVMIVDNNFVIIDVNPAFEKLSGLKADDLIYKKHCYEVLPEETCHTESCTLKRVKKEGIITFETMKQHQVTKEWFPVEITAAPLFDSEGNKIGAVEAIRDLREIKAKEKEIKDAKEYLESQVDRILPAIEALANGDLSHGELEIINDDAINKIAAAVNKASRNLKGILLKLREAAVKLASTSEELAASSQEMNASTEQISQAVQQIARGAQDTASQVDRGSHEIKRLSDIINSVAESAGVAADIAKKAEESAKEGGKSAEAAARKMAAILEVTEDTTAKVRELGSRSKEISKIVEVISSIAEQTNLLALNAAIEAARAGEHGKGFAVVAEEVRKLAEDSSKAAEKIEDLIKEIQAEIDRAVQEMERGALEVSEGSEVVNQALNALSGIVASVSEATARMLEITKAAQEQKGISCEMVTIIEQVATVAEETAAGAEEASAATEEQTASMEELTTSAQELAKLANDLREIVNSFKLDGEKTDLEEARELPARLA